MSDSDDVRIWLAQPGVCFVLACLLILTILATLVIRRGTESNTIVIPAQQADALNVTGHGVTCKDNASAGYTECEIPANAR